MTYHKNINLPRPSRTTKAESQQVLDIIPYDTLVSRKQIVDRLKGVSRLSKCQIFKQISNFARDGKIKKVPVFTPNETDSRRGNYFRVGIMG